MPGRSWFVTGTDTGVGKTWVTARIARQWTREGRRVAALKAAESGCARTPGGLVAADDALLFEAAGGWQPERCRYLFHPPVAPGVAADDLGVQIDFARIREQVRLLESVADHVLVEGAGGWLVPMGEGRTIEDLAHNLAVPVVVVARAGLGTINHTALTIRAIRDADLQVVAVVLSVLPDDDLRLAARNALEIERLTGVRAHMLDGSNADAETISAITSAAR